MRYAWRSVGIIFEHPFVTVSLWDKLIDLNKEMGVGVAFTEDEEYEGGAYIKVYVDAPRRLEVRRKVREWEKLIGDGKRIRMRLMSDEGDDLDEEGWA